MRALVLRLPSSLGFGTGLLAIFTAAGCGGGEFSSASSGGSSGRGGAAGQGQAGGGSGGSSGEASGGSGGAQGGSGGQSGAGGGGSPACTCPSGQYCQVTTRTCRACSDVSRLAFAPPEKIATVSSSTAGQQRFPRVGGTETELFYRAGVVGGEGLWRTPDYTAGYGTMVGGENEIDSGPLYVRGSSPNFYFDRVSASGDRRVMTATWDGSVGDVILAGPPLDPEVLGSSDYSIAIAAAPSGSESPRAFWMTTRFNGAAVLATAELGVNGGDVQVPNLLIETPAGNACSRTGADATPWVTPGGDLLLFRDFPLDDDCSPIDGDATDLYAAILNATTGLPPPNAPAIPLADVNRSNGGSTETDPSLSADMCFLYYAASSLDGGSDFDVYRAARH